MFNPFQIISSVYLV